MKHKLYDQVYPYTYLIIRISDNKKYHGVRYANVKNNTSPQDDLGVSYFTSSKSISKDFKKFPEKYKFKVCWTFDSVDEAIDHEYKVNSRVFYRDDWLNMTYGKNFGEHPDIGKLISQGKTEESIRKGVEKLRIFLETEEGIEYRTNISERKIEFWSNKTKEERLEILKNAHEKRDESLIKTHEKRREVINDNGETYNHLICRKSAETRKLNNIDSLIGKKRNETYNKKLASFTDLEFEKWCEGKSQRAISGAITRRNKALNLQ